MDPQRLRTKQEEEKQQCADQAPKTMTASLGGMCETDDGHFNHQQFGIGWQRPTEEVTLDNIDDAMRYQGWDAEQTLVGDIVRESLTFAAKAILRHVPRSPRRTLALQHLITARMDANMAITFRGRF